MHAPLDHARIRSAAWRTVLAGVCNPVLLRDDYCPTATRRHEQRRLHRQLERVHGPPVLVRFDVDRIELTLRAKCGPNNSCGAGLVFVNGGLHAEPKAKLHLQTGADGTHSECASICISASGHNCYISCIDPNACATSDHFQHLQDRDTTGAQLSTSRLDLEPRQRPGDPHDRKNCAPAPAVASPVTVHTDFEGRRPSALSQPGEILSSGGGAADVDAELECRPSLSICRGSADVVEGLVDSSVQRFLGGNLRQEKEARDWVLDEGGRSRTRAGGTGAWTDGRWKPSSSISPGRGLRPWALAHRPLDGGRERGVVVALGSHREGESATSPTEPRSEARDDLAARRDNARQSPRWSLAARQAGERMIAERVGERASGNSAETVVERYSAIILAHRRGLTRATRISRGRIVEALDVRSRQAQSRWPQIGIAVLQPRWTTLRLFGLRHRLERELAEERQ